MNKNITIFLLCCASLTVVGCSTMPSPANETNVFSYKGWLKDEIIEIRSPAPGSVNGVVIFGGDEHGIAEFCGSDSKFQCVFSKRLAFAVPRSGVNVSEWRVREYKFEVVAEGLEIELFGKKICNLFLIRSPAEATLAGTHSGKPTYWLYSEKLGVVGFGEDSIPDNHSKVYWMVNDFGFAPNQAN